MLNIFKCTMGGNEGNGCGDTDPKNFVKGSTGKCKVCHAKYQQRWSRAKTLGLPVKQIRVTGRGRGALVTIVPNESDDSSDDSSDDDEKISKSKYLKLKKENVKLRDEIATFYDDVYDITECVDEMEEELRDEMEELCKKFERGFSTFRTRFERIRSVEE